jgi:hypothetical protein
MIIYIAIAENMLNIIECEVSRKVENKIHFSVVNGMWDGYFDFDQQIIRVKQTREVIRAKIVDCGIVKGKDYNERIDNVIKYIKKHGPISQAELGKYGYIPSASQQTPSIKKRRKSNTIQTIILSENVELVINKINLSVALYKNKELVRAMSLEVNNGT